jgi:hypothetical protein
MSGGYENAIKILKGDKNICEYKTFCFVVTVRDRCYKFRALCSAVAYCLRLRDRGSDSTGGSNRLAYEC